MRWMSIISWLVLNTQWKVKVATGGETDVLEDQSEVTEDHSAA